MLKRFLRLAMAATMLAVTPAFAQTDVKAAQQEGKVTVYVLWLTDEIQAVTKAFKAKYPGIEVDFYRNGGPLVSERIRSEFRATGRTADIVSIDPAELNRFASDGIIVPYASPELAAIPERFRRPDNMYTTFFEYLNGYIINTKAFPDQATWPKDWDDFKNPRPEWTGKICLSDIRVAAHAYNNIAGLYSSRGEGVWDIYQGLAKAKARLYTGAPQAAQLAASGQCPIIFQIPFQNFVGPAKAGAPVAWIAPASGMIPSPVAIAMVKNAANPNAAKLFYDFVLSEEGQAALASLHVTPLRTNASRAWWPEKDLTLQPYGEVKIMEYDPIKADALREQLLAKGGQILGLQ